MHCLWSIVCPDQHIMNAYQRIVNNKWQ